VWSRKKKSHFRLVGVGKKEKEKEKEKEEGGQTAAKLSS